MDLGSVINRPGLPPGVAGASTDSYASLLDDRQRERARITSAQETESEPIRKQVTREMGDYEKAAAQPIAKEALPEPPKRTPLKTIQDSAGIYMALAGLGGLMTRQPMTAALNAMTAAMQGAKEGDAAKFDQSYADYKTNFDRAMKNNADMMNEQKTILANKRLTIQDKLDQLKMVDTKYGNQLREGKDDFATLFKVMDAQQKAATHAQDHADKMDLELQRLKLAQIKTAQAGGGAELSEDDLRFMAQQRLAGDKTVFQNLGRGAQGSKNIVALRHMIREEAEKTGVKPGDIATIDAELSGITAGERTLGTRTANVGMAVNEAEQFADLATKASEAVDRTDYPALNNVLLAAERGSGDESVVRLSTAVNGLINAYSRAVSPSGTPTVSDKEHAREILTTAYSKGQFRAAVDQMKIEMAAAKKSPIATKEELRTLRGGAARVTAPPEALAHLKQHPELAAKFKEKYGYLPE